MDTDMAMSVATARVDIQSQHYTKCHLAPPMGWEQGSCSTFASLKNIGGCVEACKCSGRICTIRKNNTWDSNTFFSEGPGQAGGKGWWELCGVQHSKYQVLHLGWDNPAWGPAAAVTGALKSLETTKILLGKDWATSVSFEDGPAVSRSQVRYLPTKIFQGI